MSLPNRDAHSDIGLKIIGILLTAKIYSFLFFRSKDLTALYKNNSDKWINFEPKYFPGQDVSGSQI